VFTNVRFLQELKEETTRMSRIKHLLVLASRILAIIFLVLAFAQPILPVSKDLVSAPSSAISIYIDNSFSMESQSKEGPLLEVARKKAREIAAAYPPSTRIQLLTNDFEAVHQRLFTREEFLDELERVKISPVSRTISEVSLRQSEALHSGSVNNGARFIVSDFQNSFCDFLEVAADSNSVLNLIALPLQESSNIYIDSCWLASPVVQLNTPVEISVRIVNSSDKDADNIPVRLKINGTQRAVASAAVEAGKSVDISMTFSVNTPGWQKVAIEITDHPVTFDDQYYMSFNVRENLMVMSLDGNTAGPYLKALYGQDAFFRYTSVPYNQVNYAALKDQDLIVLNQLPEISSGLTSELQRYVQQGGTVVCFPDSTASVESYSVFLQTLVNDRISSLVRGQDKVLSIDMRHPVFQEVFEKSKQNDGAIDYPAVSAHYVLENSGRTNRNALVKLGGGDAFLAEYSSGRGSVYFFTVPLSPGFSNLSRHALVVPMMYRIALLSMRAPLMSYDLGSSTAILLPATINTGEENIHLRNADLKTDVVPLMRTTSTGVEVMPGPAVQHSGNYTLESSTGVVASIALNYDRKESPMQFVDEDDLAELGAEAKGSVIKVFKPGSGDLSKTIHRENEGVPLWKYCIIAALLFLLAETLLLRFWKTT
jgi:hypothetical protein